MSTPAGWYPDPDHPGVQRLWDGDAWTEHRKVAPVAPPPAVPPPETSGTGRAFLIIAGIVGLVIVAVIGLGSLRNRTTTTDTDTSSDTGGHSSETHIVRYSFSGTAVGGSVTYSTDSGQEQRDISLPGYLEYGAGSGFESWVSLIQNLGDSGVVTCEILVDGKVVSSNTSSAAYGIASCDATTNF